MTADFSFNPESRKPEEIVKALLNQFTAEEKKEAKLQRQKRRQENKPLPRAAFNKHLRAFFDGKAAAMNHLMERIKKRDPAGEKPIIGLLDGALSLENSFRTTLEEHGLTHRLDALILDIIHVSQYLWKAATAIHGEKNPERDKWVEKKLYALLESKVGRVIGGLKQILKKRKLSKAKQKTITKTITYFKNHRHMMDYKTYLEKGFPIATGLVEAACGSLVKDRMEQSGMRWTINGAQSILDLRAVKKNGDWEQFWNDVIASKKKAIYPDSYINPKAQLKKMA